VVVVLLLLPVVVVLLLLLMGVALLLAVVVLVVGLGVLLLLLLLVLCWPPPAVLLPLGQISSSSSKTSLHSNVTIGKVPNVTLPGLPLPGIMAGVASHNPLASQGMGSTEHVASAAGSGVGFQAPSLLLVSGVLLLQLGVLRLLLLLPLLLLLAVALLVLLLPGVALAAT
jgi:hypothetical protein